jgi:hypothetical protein
VFAVLSQTLATPAPPSTQQPRFRSRTNVVPVDVFATKRGVPVQDLTAADLELFEDNVPQKIDTFEHIVIDPARPGERVAPASPSQAVVLAGDPRGRVFVIYLDIEQVDREVRGRHTLTHRPGRAWRAEGRAAAQARGRADDGPGHPSAGR